MWCHVLWHRSAGVYHHAVFQIWGHWHLCCDVWGDHEDSGPHCHFVHVPDVSIWIGILCADAKPGKKGNGLHSDSSSRVDWFIMVGFVIMARWHWYILFFLPSTLRNSLRVCRCRWCKLLSWWLGSWTTRTISLTPILAMSFPLVSWLTGFLWALFSSCQYCWWTWWWACILLMHSCLAVETVMFDKHKDPPCHCLLLFTAVDRFSSWGHCRGPKKCCTEEDCHAGTVCIIITCHTYSSSLTHLFNLSVQVMVSVCWPQIDLHTALEDKLPYWFMKRVDKPSITIYPNRKCSKVQHAPYLCTNQILHISMLCRVVVINCN